MFYPLNYRCWRPIIKLGGAHHPNAFWNEVGMDSPGSLAVRRIAALWATNSSRSFPEPAHLTGFEPANLHLDRVARTPDSSTGA